MSPRPIRVPVSRGTAASVSQSARRSLSSVVQMCAPPFTLAQTEARGPPRGGVGERTDPLLCSPDDQWQASSENRKDIIPEHETNLRVRAGDFPPSSVREARVNKGLRSLNRAFF